MSLKPMCPIMPEDCLKRLWGKIPRHILITFFAACLWGLFAHLYVFTDKILNLDDIGALFGTEYGIASGRWLLPFFTALDGPFSAPWLIGAISLFLLAVAACLVVSIMRIKNPLSCILTAALLVAFPAVTSTMAYMFSADTYFLALALACFAAYVTQKYRWGFLPGAVAITLSMGIYQSYFSVAALLLVGVLFLDTLDGKDSFRVLFLRGLRFVATLGAGIAAYMVVVQITTRSVALVDYMGISDMGKLSLTDLPRLISNAYLAHWGFFIQSDTAAHFPFMKYIFLLVGLAAVLLLFFILRRRKLKGLQLLLLALLAAVYPLACNLVYVMAPSAPVHILMLYGMAGTLLVPLVLAEYYAKLQHSVGEAQSPTAALGALCCWVVMAAMALTAYGYVVFSNHIYLKAELTYEHVYAYSNRLLSAIERAEGYDVNVPIVLVGQALEDVRYPATPELDAFTLTGVDDATEMINSYSYAYILRRYLGAPNIIYGGDSTVPSKFETMDEVALMPSYPSPDGIRLIDGHLVVKLG